MSGQAKKTTLRFYKERLLRVLVHIQQHLDEPLALQELAKLACLSPHHFHHVFSGMLNESLASHVRRLRLERAAWRLKLTRMQIVQIALEAGYETHEAFTRAFHRSFGLSPRQFRLRDRRSAQIQIASNVHYQHRNRPPALRMPETNPKAMKVTLKYISPLRVAFMRHTGPYNEVGKTWDEFLMHMGKEGLLGGNQQFIGICHDDPAVTSPKKLRYDACLTASESFCANGDIGVQTIPGGDYAVLTHFGPYHKLGESYARLLGQWLPRSGRNLRMTPCFEVYFNSPESTDPEDLVTDIYAPLESTGLRK